MPTLTTLTSFNGSNGAGPLGGLIADAAGDLFGTTQTGRGTETPPAYIDTSRPASDYARAVDELLQLYTRIDMAVPSLPIASVMPFVKSFWGTIKFEFALIGDILLMVPINIVVFIRNIFPGRWSYKCFSCRYLKTVAGWVWRGECTIPAIVFRPLVIILLHWHFRSRLSALRHQLLLETGFSQDAAKAELAKLDRAMEFWQQGAASY